VSSYTIPTFFRNGLDVTHPKEAKKGVCACFVLQLLNSGRLQRVAINDSSAQRLVAQE